jgi:uncharacterized membrane protein
MMHDGWGGMWFGPLFMWLPLILLIVAIIFIVRLYGGNDRRTTNRPTPRQILDERLANGDIDQAEYQARREALDG